jgi:hypothetical protein
MGETRRKILWAFGWRPSLQKSEIADAPTLEEPMMLNDAPLPAQAAIRTDLGAIFVSMELSRRAWLITSLSPGAGEKMSKHSVPASDVAGLLHRFAELKRKAAARTGRDFPIIVIQEAGLDGLGAQNAVGGFGEAWAGSIGSVSSIVWMTDALQGQ